MLLPEYLESSCGADQIKVPPHSPIVRSESGSRGECQAGSVFPGDVSRVHPHVSKVRSEKARLVTFFRIKLETDKVKDDFNSPLLLKEGKVDVQQPFGW